MDEVAQRIIAAGGEDFSRFVGTITYPRQSSWFTLKDGTCLGVTPAAASEAGRDVVGRLTLGEPGRGYTDKLQRHREVTAVELR